MRNVLVSHKEQENDVEKREENNEENSLISARKGEEKDV